MSNNHGAGRRVASSREDAWIETVVRLGLIFIGRVASSREDAWIETSIGSVTFESCAVASSREDAWIETIDHGKLEKIKGRVLPRGRVD